MQQMKMWMFVDQNGSYVSGTEGVGADNCRKGGRTGNQKVIFKPNILGEYCERSSMGIGHKYLGKNEGSHSKAKLDLLKNYIYL